MIENPPPKSCLPKSPIRHLKILGPGNTRQRLKEKGKEKKENERKKEREKETTTPPTASVQNSWHKTYLFGVHPSPYSFSCWSFFQLNFYF